jgi:hypothetical protein
MFSLGSSPREILKFIIYDFRRCSGCSKFVNLVNSLTPNDKTKRTLFPAKFTEFKFIWPVFMEKSCLNSFCHESLNPTILKIILSLTNGALMKNSLVLAGIGMILLTALAMTTHAANKTNQIKIKYVPPKNPEHQLEYDTLKERYSLENLQEFLSPFRLPWPLTITLTGCAGEADAMYSEDEITICYEYIEDLEEYMPEETTKAGIEPIDTLIGPFVDTVLHEFAHALFDYLEPPILGREEDAADQVSAYIYLQLGKDESRRLIMGTVYAYLLEVQDTDAPTMEEYADEHSTSEQRAFNLTCIAYGADPKLFADLPALVGLPQERVDICVEEYELISQAYEMLIGPHIDPVLAKKIFDKSWLPEKTSDMLDSDH